MAVAQRRDFEPPVVVAVAVSAPACRCRGDGMMRRFGARSGAGFPDCCWVVDLLCLVGLLPSGGRRSDGSMAASCVTLKR